VTLTGIEESVAAGGAASDRTPLWRLGLAAEAAKLPPSPIKLR
jgi:hypothetical protein